MAATTLFLLSPDICSSTSADGSTILSVEQGKLYSVIGAGSLIWAKLAAAPSGLPLDAIVDALQADFESVPRRQLEGDVKNFLRQLNDKGIVRVSDGHIPRYGKALGDRLEAASVFFLLGAVDILLKLRLRAWAALLLLVAADIALKVGGFRALHRAVQRWPRSRGPAQGSAIITQICAAVDRAGTVYLKQALCLQRSAVTACLLRRRGMAAEMVIGCHKMPFHGHAWVEIDGEVVNDKQKVRGFYSALARC